MCKVAHSHSPALHDESKMYAALQDLQGDVIPKLYGSYKVWESCIYSIVGFLGTSFQDRCLISQLLQETSFFLHHETLYDLRKIYTTKLGLKYVTVVGYWGDFE
jgi:hypothetical protein